MFSFGTWSQSPTDPKCTEVRFGGELFGLRAESLCHRIGVRTNARKDRDPGNTPPETVKKNSASGAFLKFSSYFRTSGLSHNFLSGFGPDLCPEREFWLLLISKLFYHTKQYLSNLMHLKHAELNLDTLRQNSVLNSNYATYFLRIFAPQIQYSYRIFSYEKR